MMNKPYEHAAKRPPQMSPAAGLFALGKWLILGVGVVFLVIAFARANAIQAASLSGMACFFAIMSRIFQAEEHRRLR